MSRIRITCKAPPDPPHVPGDIRISWVPSWQDVRVVLVADDGAEHDVDNVLSVSFSVRAGEVATATLTFEDVEISAEAEVPA